MRFSPYYRYYYSSRTYPDAHPARPPPSPVRRPVTNRIFKKSESLAVSDAEASTPPPISIVCPNSPKRLPLHHIRSESPPSSDKRATADLSRSSGPAKYEVSPTTTWYTTMYRYRQWYYYYYNSLDYYVVAKYEVSLTQAVWIPQQLL